MDCKERMFDIILLKSLKMNFIPGRWSEKSFQNNPGNYAAFMPFTSKRSAIPA